MLSVAVPALATTVPTIDTLLQRSDFVVLGRLLDVGRPTKALRQLTVQVDQILGAAREDVELELSLSKVKRLAVTYRQLGKTQPDFAQRAASGKPSVFFVRVVPDRVEGVTRSLHLELADMWFGVHDRAPRLLAEIRRRLAR